MTSLAGKRILLVEDEFLIAALVEHYLAELGAVVVGPAYRLGEGVALARQEAIDAAVLDVNINGQRSDSIADVLAARKIPFVLATGYGAAEDDSAAPVLPKPYNAQALAGALRRAIDAGG